MEQTLPYFMKLNRSRICLSEFVLFPYTLSAWVGCTYACSTNRIYDTRRTSVPFPCIQKKTNSVVSLLLNRGVCILLLHIAIPPEGTLKVQNSENISPREHIALGVEWKSHQHNSEFIGSEAQVHSKEIGLGLFTNEQMPLGADPHYFSQPRGICFLYCFSFKSVSANKGSWEKIFIFIFRAISFPILFIVCSLYSWRRRRALIRRLGCGSAEKEEPRDRPYLAFLNFNPTAIPATCSSLAHIYWSTLFSFNITLFLSGLYAFK